MPLGTPERAQTSLRCRSAHICAKICKFRPCARILMVKCGHGSSTHQTIAKKFCYLLRSNVSVNFEQNGMAKILAKRLPAQKARRGYPAADALRQSRGRSWREPSKFTFLVTSFLNEKEVTSKHKSRARAKGAV